MPNPRWYSELYHSHPSFRRDLSMRSLGRICMEKDRPFQTHHYKYDFIYRDLIHRSLIDGFVDRGFEVAPNNDVRSYFGLEIADLTDDIPF